MRQRLKSVLALLDNDSVEQLIRHFLTLKHTRMKFHTLMIAMLNANDRQLICDFHSDEKLSGPVKIGANVEDINHPLVQVMRHGAPLAWDSLNQGVRIENEEFREWVESLPVGCGLYAFPLFDFRRHACGVIAVFAEDTKPFAATGGIFGIYCHVFQHRLIKLQEVEQMKSQLAQIRDLLKSHEQHKKQLNELLSSMSESDGHGFPGLSHDYSNIDDLPKALDTFEQSILVQRQRIYGNDKNRIAKSLGIAPRTLAYKFTKYGF